jgi:hypothetical protein
MVMCPMWVLKLTLGHLLSVYTMAVMDPLIVAANSTPNGRRGVNHSKIRISDLAVTAASLKGLRFNSKVIGSNLSADL